MTVEEKIEMLAETFDVEPEDLSEDTELESLDDWGSLTKLSLIVMFDDEFGKKVTSDDIKKFVTVGDIMKVME